MTQDPKYQSGDPPTPVSLPEDVVISPDTLRNERVPPGQSRTRKWPVLDAWGPPENHDDPWTLRVYGLVDREWTLRTGDFAKLPRTRVFSDFHCVTQWSRLGNLWAGVASRAIAEMAGVQPTAQFVVLHGRDHGWTTNLTLEDFLADDVLLADTHDGDPIDWDHGGPVRLVVPRLYAWKSAKWLCGIEFTGQDHPGYWEQNGYHNHGDPWTEERFS